MALPARVEIATIDQALAYAREAKSAAEGKVKSTSGKARERWQNAVNLYEATIDLPAEYTTQTTELVLKGMLISLETADRVALEAAGIERRPWKIFAGVSVGIIVVAGFIVFFRRRKRK